MDTASHLSVIVDLSPTQWYLSSKATDANPHPLSLDTFFSQLFVFLNSHIACKDENTLTVYGALPGRSILLYSSTGEAKADQDVVADANTYRPFNVLDSTIMKSLADHVQLLGVSETETPVGLVGALTKSLCYINRVSMISAQNEQPVALDPRILVLSVSPDQSSSYIPIMNSIFSAQKLKVTIDVCKIYGPDSVFLQQAAHLTGGSYVHLDHPNALLQYLTMSFLPPPGIRQLLSVPTQDKIDFRAACFCHKRIVDIGFVCSVCLSIFCQPVPVCSTCRQVSVSISFWKVSHSELRPFVRSRHASARLLDFSLPGISVRVCRLNWPFRYAIQPFGFKKTLSCSSVSFGANASLLSRTKFPIKTLQRLNAARPMPVTSMDPSAPSLPSSTSIRVNAANGNGVRLNGAQR